MITVEPTDDLDLVRSIVTNSDVWKAARMHDGAPPKDQYHAPRIGFTYLLARRQGDPCGIIMLEFVSPRTIRTHIAMLAYGWGNSSTQAALGAIDWAKHNTGCERLVAEIPTYNDLAIGLVKRIGMVEISRKKAAFLKNGEPYDARCFEVVIER